MDKSAYEQYIRDFDINLLDCRFLGRGHNGVVYMLPDGKVIKICYEEKSCKKEYSILERIKENKYFPRVYGMSGNYMIRDYVDGVDLRNYIKKYGLTKELTLKILDLLEEFKALEFKKEDIRCKDVLVQPNESLMIIDPKKFYSKDRDFPRHLVKGFHKLGVLNFFILVTKNEKPNLYKQWIDKIQEYIKEKLV